MRHLEVDPDLDRMREQPRFKEMVDAAKQRLKMDKAALRN